MVESGASSKEVITQKDISDFMSCSKSLTRCTEIEFDTKRSTFGSTPDLFDANKSIIKRHDWRRSFADNQYSKLNDAKNQHVNQSILSSQELYCRILKVSSSNPAYAIKSWQYPSPDICDSSLASSPALFSMSSSIIRSTFDKTEDRYTSNRQLKRAPEQYCNRSSAGNSAVGSPENSLSQGHRVLSAEHLYKNYAITDKNSSLNPGPLNGPFITAPVIPAFLSNGSNKSLTVCLTNPAGVQMTSLVAEDDKLTDIPLYPSHIQMNSVQQGPHLALLSPCQDRKAISTVKLASHNEVDKATDIPTNEYSYNYLFRQKTSLPTVADGLSSGSELESPSPSPGCSRRVHYTDSENKLTLNLDKIRRHKNNLFPPGPRFASECRLDSLQTIINDDNILMSSALVKALTEEIRDIKRTLNAANLSSCLSSFPGDIVPLTFSSLPPPSLTSFLRGSGSLSQIFTPNHTNRSPIELDLNTM